MCVYLCVCEREIEIKPVRVPVCDCVVCLGVCTWCGLQCGAVCCSVVQFVAVWCSLLQCFDCVSLYYVL